MMADIVYRMAEKSVDEASAWYEYQPEVPEKLKKRNSCKLVPKRSTKQYGGGEKSKWMKWCWRYRYGLIKLTMQVSWRIEIPVSEQLVETTQAGIGIDKCIWFQ